MRIPRIGAPPVEDLSAVSLADPVIGPLQARPRAKPRPARKQERCGQVDAD